MILPPASLSALTAADPQIVVIGGGPLGLVTALALADRGCKVAVLESGLSAPVPRLQDLAADRVLTPDTHHDPVITTARRLGGAGCLWGGRCVPCDPVDFIARPWLDLPGWPVSKSELDPYLGPACAALGAGAAVFRDPVAGVVPGDGRFSIDTLERWSNEPRIHVLHRARLEQSPGLSVAPGVTATGFTYHEDGRIAGIELWCDGGETGHLPCDRVVLAAGGNASARLLMNEELRHPGRYSGGADGVLGRGYMGHVNGQIADIVFENDRLHDAMDFYVDGHGSYVRRRFAPTAATQEAAGIANIAFWPVVPEVSQAAHRSGPLSAVFMALTTPVLGRKIIAEPIRLKHIGPPPRPWGPHIRNVLFDLPRTVGFVPWFLWNRKYSKYRVPGFFLHNAARRYGLEFHSEHLPDPASRLMLNEDRDASGLRRMDIDFRFAPRDVDSVLKAHAVFEDWLTGEGFGRLVYRYDTDRLDEGVLAEARHGNHQEGTMRMGATPATGVVDANATAFHVPNLHAVTTGILPSSSQANPTLTAMQLGLRLVDHIAPAA